MQDKRRERVTQKATLSLYISLPAPVKAEVLELFLGYEILSNLNCVEGSAFAYLV